MNWQLVQGEHRPRPVGIDSSPPATLQNDKQLWIMNEWKYSILHQQMDIKESRMNSHLQLETKRDFSTQ